MELGCEFIFHQNRQGGHLTSLSVIGITLAIRGKELRIEDRSEELGVQHGTVSRFQNWTPVPL